MVRVRIRAYLFRRRTYSSLAAWTQAALSSVCLLWFYWLYLGLTSWPSLAISLLAAAAAIMAVRAPNWSKPEQVVWILIACALFGIESRSIAQDHQLQETQRQSDLRTQDINFAAVLAKNQKNFESTIKNVDSVFEKTKEAANTANTAVKTITGGNSFCYIEIAGDANPLVTEVVPILKVVGNYPLTNLGIRVVDYAAFEKDIATLGHSGSFTPTSAVTLDATITNIGQVPATGTIFFEPIGINLKASETVKNYNIEFHALNGSWREYLRARNVAGQWVDAVRVVRIDREGEHYPALLQRINKQMPRDGKGRFSWN